MLKVFDFERTPIVDIVNEILVDASNRGASDIHFDPKDNVLQIRIRIDGRLVNYATVPSEYIKNLITRIKIISGMNITESRLPQDGAIKGIVKDIELDLRVSSINTNKGEKIVIRILDYTLSLNGIEKLGFSDYNYKKVIEMINEPNGIILVTGATGTGKTTTVYSMLQRLSNETTNIMSIEDPVEMDIDNVNQIQVNPEIGLTFATALRSILRQDPNIIMIGEIRDSETATIAIRASVTGHLVLSTLHTNDSLSTIERLMDMEVEKYLLAEALEGIVSQRLARRLCSHCKKLRKTTAYEKDLIKKTLNLDIDEIYEAVGCDKCNHGYKGRIAFQEVLKIDQKIQDALSMNIRKDKLRNLVYNGSVITLLQDGMIKVLRGDTTIEELLRLVEFDDESIAQFNLSKDILDSELEKHLDFYDNIEEKNEEIDNNDDIEEIIVPETNDVIIDSIDDNSDDDSEINNDNMESLDNDDDFIDKIDQVIDEDINNENIPETETEVDNQIDTVTNIDEKPKKKRKNKKKKNKKDDADIVSENNDSIDTSAIIDDNLIVNDNNDSETTNDNMESLDNDNKIDQVIDEDINNESIPETEVDNQIDTVNNFDEKPKKKRKNKKKKNKKDDVDIVSENNDSIDTSAIIDDNLIVNDNNDSETTNDNMESLDNDEDFIDKIDQVIDEDINNESIPETEVDNQIDTVTNFDEKPKKKRKNKKKKNKKDDADVISENIDSIDTSAIIDDNIIVNDNNNSEITNDNIESLDNDNKIDQVVDDKNNSEVSQIDTVTKFEDDNSQDVFTPDVNSDDTFITKVEKYVKSNKKDDIDIIDEVANNVELNDIIQSDVKEEITDNDIAELEEAIETIKVNDEKSTNEMNNDISNDSVDDTIRISINESNNNDNELGVSEVKTVHKSSKDEDTMASLDYNTNFIDKIYDSITNTGEFKPIEKNNIDYEKVERLESMQEEIGSRVSRMLNKKRYKKNNK